MSHRYSNVASRLASKQVRPKKFGCVGVAAGMILLLFIPGVITLNIVRANTVETHADCVISEKEDRALASLDKRDPRVYTDCGVFVVKDELLRFHFAAADVYNELQVGDTVDLTTVGWRFGPLSWFPNVVEVKEAAQ